MARMWKEGSTAFWLANLDGEAKTAGLPLPHGRWNRVIDSCDVAWDGPGSLLPGRLDEPWPDVAVGAFGFALFVMEEIGQVLW